MRVVCMLLLLTGHATAERHPLVVTAAPPLDGERLADALRAYLDSFSVEVRTAPAAPAVDLRDQLAATHAAGAGVRAIAAIRIADASTGTVEIQLADLVAGKSLVTTVPRLPRDEDFYRAVALKVQALLRSALYEEAAALTTKAPELARLVATPPQPPAPPPRRPRHRLSFEAAYTLVSFPTGGLIQHGVSLLGRVEIGRYAEISLGVDALGTIRAVRDDVSAVAFTVPIRLAAGAHLRRPRFEGAISAVAELLVIGVDPAAPDAVVHSDRFVAPAFGAQIAGRVRVASPVWLYLRLSALGVAYGSRYLVRGAPLVAIADAQVDAEAGFGVALW